MVQRLSLALGGVGENWHFPQETFICGRGGNSALEHVAKVVHSDCTAFTIAAADPPSVMECVACATAKWDGTHVMPRPMHASVHDCPAAPRSHPGDDGVRGGGEGGGGEGGVRGDGGREGGGEGGDGGGGGGAPLLHHTCAWQPLPQQKPEQLLPQARCEPH